MKVAMVYDYSRKKCGIKMYGDVLVGWLRKFGVNVSICDLKNQRYEDSVEAALCARRGDIVHTQHEFGLFKGHFGWTQLLYYTILKTLRKFHITTLHTVLTPSQALTNYIQFGLPYSKEKPWEAIRGLIISALSPFMPVLFSDKLIVHTVRGYELLPDWAKAKTEFIPHLSPTPSEAVLEKARQCGKKREVPKTIRVITPGFLRPTKRYDWAIHALVMLKKEGFEHPVEYTIIGTYQNEDGKIWFEYIKEFAEQVNEYTEKLGLRINVIEQFMDKRELIERACSSDVVLLPYSDPTQEASGILHDSLVCGKHIVVPEIGDVKNFPKAFYPFKFENPLETMKEALRRAFEELLKGNRCNPWALAYAYYTSADKVAKKHVELYSKVRSQIAQ
ncbi:hypothetical protein IPA_05970 [Ignicoccus pacificus DSM 13166]|uniref:Glycosyl transferase family 1 domain-containing protein n=1 Tax=Ignicoccus pacificus DSM 13166 TaxID=940294 RepID=A0A977KCT7_9CREN|nr:hypothetical protein IPA_05970 [Ignicoccus pacificus DSM 13166]